MIRSPLFWKFLGIQLASLVIAVIASAVLGSTIGGIAMGAVVAFLASCLLTRRFSRDLKTLNDTVVAIGRGDQAARPRAPRGQELGQLTHKVDAMARSVGERTLELARDRDKLAAILSGMVEGVVAVERDERVVHMNSAAARILGMSETDSLGKKIWEVTRVLEASEAVSKTLQEGVVVKLEVIRVRGPRDQTLEIVSSPLLDGPDNLGGAVLVIQDVTELRRLQAVRQEFVANVSHELKTPIAAIRGLAETLVDDADMPEKTRRRFLDKVCEQSIRLSALVTDLLSLAQLEANAGHLAMVEIDLRTPVMRSIRELTPPDGEVPVQVDLPTEQVPVMGHEELLQQMVTNLLDNALKYTTDRGPVEVCLTTSEQHALLEIKDRGIGIDAVHHKRIFERFYRVDKARSREVGGTGLGLAIVKHVSIAHHGEVDLQSQPGVGTTFGVRLPLATENGS